VLKSTEHLETEMYCSPTQCNSYKLLLVSHRFSVVFFIYVLLYLQLYEVNYRALIIIIVSEILALFLVLVLRDTTVCNVGSYFSFIYYFVSRSM